jgi:hypothetical protein
MPSRRERRRLKHLEAKAHRRGKRKPSDDAASLELRDREAKEAKRLRHRTDGLAFLLMLIGGMPFARS